MSTTVDNAPASRKDPLSGKCAASENRPPPVAPRIKVTRSFSPPFPRVLYNSLLHAIRNGETVIPSSKELRLLGFNGSSSICPRQKFKLILPRLQIQNVDGSLVFSGNPKQDVLISKRSKKILLPVEDAERAIRRAHFTGSNETIEAVLDETKQRHVGLKKTINVLEKNFTTNCRDFGINKLEIKKIVDNCRSCALAELSSDDDSHQSVWSTGDDDGDHKQTCLNEHDSLTHLGTNGYPMLPPATSSLINHQSCLHASANCHDSCQQVSLAKTPYNPTNLNVQPGSCQFVMSNSQHSSNINNQESSQPVKLIVKLPDPQPFSSNGSKITAEHTSKKCVSTTPQKSEPKKLPKLVPKTSKTPRFVSMVAEVPDMQCIWYGRQNIAQATNRFTKLLLVLNDMKGELACALKGDTEAKQRLDTKVFVAQLLIKDYLKIVKKSMSDDNDDQMITNHLETLQQEYKKAEQESIFISDLQHVVSSNQINTLLVQQIETFLSSLPR